MRAATSRRLHQILCEVGVLATNLVFSQGCPVADYRYTSVDDLSFFFRLFRSLPDECVMLRTGGLDSLGLTRTQDHVFSDTINYL